MNLIWRFIYIVIMSRFQKKINLFDTTQLRLRVLPTDIDFLLHLNNGRYLSLADVARVNHLLRSDYFAVWKKHKIIAVIASEMIRFKKSLNLFQAFDIVTELLGWDDKYFYLAHYYKVNNHLYACCIVKERCLQNGNPVSPEAVLKLVNYTDPSPALPKWVFEWQDAEQTFYEESVRIR